MFSGVLTPIPSLAIGWEFSGKELNCDLLSSPRLAKNLAVLGCYALPPTSNVSEYPLSPFALGDGVSHRVCILKFSETLRQRYMVSSTDMTSTRPHLAGTIIVFNVVEKYKYCDHVIPSLG